MRHLLSGLVLLSLVLSLPTIWERLDYDRRGPVALVLDGAGLREEARREGKDLVELLWEYRRAGVGAVAFYVESVADRAARGRGEYLEGSELNLVAPEAGFIPGWFYASVPGAELIPLPQHRVYWRGQTWIGFASDVANVPLGPPPETRAAYLMGYLVVYRPKNDPLAPWPPEIPPEAGAYVFVGEEALGWPDRLEEAASLLKAPVAVIEGTSQKGLDRLAERLGALRLFSLRGEYQLKLPPRTAARKYVLAASERGHQLLYFRPYPKRGETADFLAELVRGLDARGIELGEPRVKEYRGEPGWAWVGAVAGLALLIWHLPWQVGVLLAPLLVLAAFAVGRDQAGPLLLGMVFPVLGWLGEERGLLRWVLAVSYALLGGLLLAALGSDWRTLVGLSAFRGVALLLVVPPALFLITRLPKRGWREVIEGLWNHRLRLGEAALAAALALALLVALLRRGNDAPFVPQLELALREHLSAVMVRPRFKEMFGHAVAVFALLTDLPRWVRVSLLAVGVVAEASILDSFAHYHTPLAVSMARSLNGAALGLLIGVALALIYRGAKRWLWR